MKKGRYFKYTSENCDNLKCGKLYFIEKIGDIIKKNGKEFLIHDDIGKARAFSMTDSDADVYYKSLGEIININHSVDDLLEKISIYKELYSMFGDDRYLLRIIILKKKLSEVVQCQVS